MQNRKTKLLKFAFILDKVRKAYVFKIKINSIEQKLNSFQIVQESLFKSTFLIHFNAKQQLYVDLNFSKKNDIETMIYHLDHEWKENVKSYFFRKAVRSLMFLNRLLNSAETRYWSIEFELAELVWVLRKIRHLVESITTITVIYTDHDATLEIIKQITLFISSTDRLNLRLIRASNYVQRFNLNIRHKSDRLHLISNALSRLSTQLFVSEINESELNVLFTASLVEMTSEFRKRIITDYIENLT